jgi:hypothetical protein
MQWCVVVGLQARVASRSWVMLNHCRESQQMDESTDGRNVNCNCRTKEINVKPTSEHLSGGSAVGGRRVEVTWSRSHGSTWIGRQRRRRREHTAEGNASLVGRTHGVEKEARMNEGGATLMVELLMAAANHGYGSGGRWREWDVIGGRKIAIMGAG